MLTRRMRREQLIATDSIEATPSTSFKFLHLPTEIQSLIITYLHSLHLVWGINSEACVTTLMPSYYPSERRSIWNCYALNRQFNNLTREVVWKVVNLMHLPDNSIEWFAHQIQSNHFQTDVVVGVVWSSKAIELHEESTSQQVEPDGSQATQSEKLENVELEEARANIFVSILENLPNLTLIAIYLWPSASLLYHCLEAAQYRILNSIRNFSGQLTTLALSGNLDCTFLAAFLLPFQSLEILRLTRIGQDTDNNGALSLTLSSLKNLQEIHFVESLFINNTFLTRTWSSKLLGITFECWKYSGILDINLDSFIFQFKESLRRRRLRINRKNIPKALRPREVLPRFHYSFPRLRQVNWNGHQHLVPNFEGCPLLSARLQLFTPPNERLRLQSFLRKFINKHLLLQSLIVTLDWKSIGEYDNMKKLKSAMKTRLVRQGRGNFELHFRSGN